ncbi:MAG: tRNA 2-thiouridine(34) synthase MnmA [Parcubacteria group bacterium]
MLSASKKVNKRAGLGEPTCLAPKRKAKRVFVGLSGGVDSSVAAFLLKEKGYDVTGVYIRGYNVDGCAEEDALMARRAAEQLNIPFYVWDMEREYKSEVVDYMISAYKRGITPNPDVMCNKEIKFGLFFKRSMKLGADFIATGHYARLDEKTHAIYEAKDKTKDQSYFLWTLNEETLKKTLFPLGNLLKSDVRKIAKRANLPNANRKDSQGICFLGRLKMPEFLSRFIEENPGPIITPEGKKIGNHKGLYFYTLGQRHLGIEGMGGNEIFYVAGKDMGTNSLIVAPKNHPLLFAKTVTLESVSLISESVKDNSEIFVRVRYRTFPAKAKINMLKGGKGTIVFEKPVPFVAPGQSAVFYSSECEMLGGGVIVS